MTKYARDILVSDGTAFHSLQAQGVSDGRTYGEFRGISDSVDYWVIGKPPLEITGIIYEASGAKDIYFQYDEETRLLEAEIDSEFGGGRLNIYYKNESCLKIVKNESMSQPVHAVDIVNAWAAPDRIYCDIYKDSRGVGYIYWDLADETGQVILYVQIRVPSEVE